MPQEIRSKYQRKMYEVVEYTLWEHSCRNCDKVFTLDDDKCKTYWDREEFEEYYVYYCPYCGTKHVAHT